MNNVQQLILSNRIEDAIRSLSTSLHREKILLLSLYNENESKYRMGLLRYEEYTMNKNKIVNSIMSYNDEEVDIMVDERIKTNAGYGITDELEHLLKQHKRTAFFDTISQLLKDAEEYESKKRRSPSYDRRGRELRSIQNAIQELKKEIKIQSEDREDKIIKQVEVLLDKGGRDSVEKAINKLFLLFPDSKKLQNLKKRFLEFGADRKHRLGIIQEIDSIIEGLQS